MLRQTKKKKTYAENVKMFGQAEYILHVCLAGKMVEIYIPTVFTSIL